MSMYTDLARNAVEYYIRNGEFMPLPDDLPAEFFNERAGVFVTIKKKGELRACVGTDLPVRNNLAGEIVCNAVTAATDDHRFGSVEDDELPYLSYEVSVLSSLEPVEDIGELDPLKYGLLVRGNSGKSAVLLPDLEGIDGGMQQMRVVCNKAGIDPEREEMSLYRFSVKRYVE